MCRHCYRMVVGTIAFLTPVELAQESSGLSRLPCLVRPVLTLLIPDFGERMGYR